MNRGDAEEERGERRQRWRVGSKHFSGSPPHKKARLFKYSLLLICLKVCPFFHNLTLIYMLHKILQSIKDLLKPLSYKQIKIYERAPKIRGTTMVHKEHNTQAHNFFISKWKYTGTLAHNEHNTQNTHTPKAKSTQPVPNAFSPPLTYLWSL